MKLNELKKGICYVSVANAPQYDGKDYICRCPADGRAGITHTAKLYDSNKTYNAGSLEYECFSEYREASLLETEWFEGLIAGTIKIEYPKWIASKAPLTPLLYN